MINFKKDLAALALAFAVTALASPSYAQEGGVHISRQRAQAIHECSLRVCPKTSGGITKFSEHEAD